MLILFSSLEYKEDLDDSHTMSLGALDEARIGTTLFHGIINDEANEGR